MSRSIHHPVAAVCLAVMSFGSPVLAQKTSPADAPSAEHARSLQQAGQWPEAAEAWELVVEDDADNGTAWFNLGYCLHAAGRLEHAVKAHKKASTFDDYHGIALYNLGCAYALLDRPDDALKALSGAQSAGFNLRGRVESDPDLESLQGDPRLAHMLAREQSGPRAAIQQVIARVHGFLNQSAPMVEQRFSAIMQQLTVQAHTMLGKLQKSLAEDERFAALAQKLQGLLGGRRERPVPTTEPGASTKPDPSTRPEPSESRPTVATLDQARGYQQAGDWDAAVNAYEALLVEQPDSAASWFGLAYCLHMRGDYEKAIEAHRQSATFEQTRGISLYNLACAYALTGQTDEALDALTASREAGFDLSSAIRTDSDLDSLRGDPRFKKFLDDGDGSDF